MKTKKGFKLRTICGENIIVAEGIENIDFSRIISMNESAAYLWQHIQGADFDADTLTKLLLEEYDIDGYCPSGCHPTYCQVAGGRHHSLSTLLYIVPKSALRSGASRKMPNSALPLPLIAA